MGTVWVAFDTMLHRQVAIKFMRVEQSDSPLVRGRFAQEARAAAQLQHPNVVQVHDYGIDRTGEQPMPFIVMELLSGEDLDQRLTRERRLALPIVGNLITQVARALSAAHAAGLVHRDLKPANLFLSRSDGREVIKVLDFGVAAMNRSRRGTASTRSDGLTATALSESLPARTALTTEGERAGTPLYMSPEQANNAAAVDLRSDLYSLAVVAYRALTGQFPLFGNTVADLLALHADPSHRPLPPSRHVPELSPAVDAFFDRALARDPSQRFQSARELASAFAELAEVSSRPIKVLVVDDEPDVQALIRQRFRQHIRKRQYEFIFAEHGLAALDQLTRNPDVDVVLSDINMPAMDGLTLLRHIAESHPLVRVVIVSAYGDMGNIREAMNRGAFDFLTKPIDLKDLERTIDKTAKHVGATRRAVAWAEENSLLRTFASHTLLERLQPMLSDRSVEPVPSERQDATVVVVDLRPLNTQPTGATDGAQPSDSEAVTIEDDAHSPPHANSASPAASRTTDASTRTLNETFDRLVPLLHDRNGVVEKFIANAALVVFRGSGHAERALSACLALRDLLRTPRSSVHAAAWHASATFRAAIGVALGDVYTASVGAPSHHRMDFTVLGGPVMSALLLSMHADPDQILLSPDVARQAAAYFDVRPIERESPASSPAVRSFLELTAPLGSQLPASAASSPSRSSGAFPTIDISAAHPAPRSDA